MTKQERNHKLFKDIVLRFAEESHCLSYKVAALAVKNGRIIATGINGTCAGSENCDDYFKKKHKELNVQLPFDEWIKTGYWRILHHEWSNIFEIHAEQNLIAEAARNRISLEGCDIYVSVEPCMHCTKLLLSVKPNAIYYVQKYDKTGNESSKLFTSNNILIKQI